MAARKFKIGDRVLVEKTPEMNSSWPPEMAEIFQRVVGHIFKIRGFNKIGFAEIWAKNNGSQGTVCDHSLWIEADCIRLVAKKK